ncbi:MAG: Txe/YoeB family addiction module toxin [Alphaproteobacteria bacterium]|nr:Txe/YoeB family addiction module toxin [Alphaproteobacteria bacterium]MBF0356195.1 Txe/YoeB family addiction module toxin [Alphaproteobacteria bacterium]
MKLLWTEEAWDDYLFWQASDKKTLGRINDLLKEIARTPFTGLGKPEPLKGSLKGWWSRRITGEHRLVYRIEGTGRAQQAVIVQCRYHY